ncbi:hypothetical protein [Domibacillus iocasae]|uniref:Uncharacterized protein n=1 Tax=Domibacillus iocasae TaxID=1714016 RepID=A0A1E7DU97_9BACI|nr:hypothetical protein [Domibacillus iocasae]OES46656.1 hypothetical protein BA724_00945 [Domibacillus iocasae]
MTNDQLKQWTDMIEVKFGLSGYTCFETMTAYEKNDWNETDYRFTTEWLPPGVHEREEDESNPKGTAVIELDAKTGRLNSAIFVGGEAPRHGLCFLKGEKEEVIRFVEQETGWTYGDQFIDAKPLGHNFSFQTAYKGIPVSPEGFIHVSLDEQKKLTFFSKQGPAPGRAEESGFQLTIDSIELLAEKRLVFVEYPSKEEEKWLPFFMIDDVLVDNQTGSAVEERQEILTWKTAKNKKVKRKLIQMAPADIEPDRLFEFPPHPDTKPITKKGYAKIREASTEFLQTYVPKESGEWSLSNIKRTNGVIEARLTNIKDVSVVPRIWQLLIDKDTYEIMNYHDRSPMLEQFADYEQAPKPVLSKKEAFKKIKPFLSVKPVYAYDGNTYRLSGKLDSNAAVHAVTGEIVHF